MASVFFSPASFLIEYSRDVCLFCVPLYIVSFLTECVCVLRNFVHGAVTCPGRPTGWTIDVTILCYTPTPTPLGGQSYVKLSTQWGGHVTAHCPPSGMANVTKHCPPSGMDGESNGENVGENLNHSYGAPLRGPNLMTVISKPAPRSTCHQLPAASSPVW